MVARGGPREAGGPTEEGHVEFGFSEEQEELRKSVRRFLEDKSPVSEVRRLMETSEGYDAAVWAQMADQLGLQSLAIPEEYGGAGFGYVSWASSSRRWGERCSARRTSRRSGWRRGPCSPRATRAR